MTTLRPEQLDELLADYQRPEDLLGDDGLFRQLKKALLERALGAELTDHLGYEKSDPAGHGSGNSRNGHLDKTVLTDDGEVPIVVPRDRNGTFEPAVVPKGMRRLEGFDAKVLSLYARGLTVREIRSHLEELYRVLACPELVVDRCGALLVGGVAGGSGLLQVPGLLYRQVVVGGYSDRRSFWPASIAHPVPSRWMILHGIGYASKQRACQN